MHKILNDLRDFKDFMELDIKDALVNIGIPNKYAVLIKAIASGVGLFLQVTHLFLGWF